GGFSGDNGPAAGAQLNSPSGVAVDAQGNVYIADSNNCRIRKVSGGVITTVVGFGVCGVSEDGVPAAAALISPVDVAVDGAGNLFFAENSARVRKISGGVLVTVAGNGLFGFSGDNGPATSAQISSPNGVAVDTAGNLYIADTGNARIRKVSGGV